ncbi:MAG: endonuclease domain-containing protein [Calditrichaceae bacterium]|nr:endonuclease domain-containing protein [Calditrichaceae bacterium]MBN2708956.1 endonuclease domain-containing protein [Calditrichaceae bacterium]RQV97521.1 MAG: endonuclease domain-containing protein [Calditrichota bacterium]
MSRAIIHYRPDLKDKSRELRKRCTKAEIILWKYIRRKQIKGYQFYRQKPIDNYIADFFCYELMLAIEIDGISHNNKEEYDRRRDIQFNDLGIHVLRFYDQDVHKNLDGVLEALKDWIDNCGQSRNLNPPTPL